MLPLSTPARYHHGDLRAALLAATGELLASEGVEALSLREVSRRAGVSHAAAYNHFRDKAALVRAYVAATFARFAGELRSARAAATDPLDALVRIGVAYVLFAYRNPAEFRIMFRPELCGPTGDDDAAAANLESYDLLVDTIVEARRARAIGGDPNALVLAAWSTVHGLSALVVDGPDALPFAGDARAVEGVARSTIGVLLTGMKSGGAGAATASRVKKGA